MNSGDSARTKDIERFRNHLVESLRLLASDYETQTRVLPSSVHIPDEVALIFGEEFLLADQILKAGRITQDQYLKLKEIDYILAGMSGHEHAEIWTLEALQNRPEWQKIRSMAREVLNDLGMPLAKPNLDWFTYVSSRVTRIL